jgi:quinol monooxygenase YgiN
MTAMQFSLFNAQPQAATVNAEPSVNARNAKRQLDTLRSQLAIAQADLEDVNYNLSVVTTHQRASREGRIDANCWDAAMRFGMLDLDEEPGIARFDVAEQQDDATRLVLIEAYRSPEAAAEHKETAHYANDECYALVTARNAAAAAARSPVGQGLGCAVGAPGELQSDFQSR